MIYHLYPKKIEEFLRDPNNRYIPRKIKLNEHLLAYRRYWICTEEANFKVENIYNVENKEYYSVKYASGLFGELSYPINSDYTYELYFDKFNIGSISNMINNKRSYKGYEIRYWFFIKNIDLSSDKYRGFASFLCNGNNNIADDKSYFLYALNDNGIYKDCKMVLEK